MEIELKNTIKNKILWHSFYSILDTIKKKRPIVLQTHIEALRGKKFVKNYKEPQ